MYNNITPLFCSFPIHFKYLDTASTEEVLISTQWMNWGRTTSPVVQYSTL